MTEQNEKVTLTVTEAASDSFSMTGNLADVMEGWKIFRDRVDVLRAEAAQQMKEFMGAQQGPPRPKGPGLTPFPGGKN